MDKRRAISNTTKPGVEESSRIGNLLLFLSSCFVNVCLQIYVLLNIPLFRELCLFTLFCLVRCFWLFQFGMVFVFNAVFLLLIATGLLLYFVFFVCLISC